MTEPLNTRDILLEELRDGQPIDVRRLQPGDFRDIDTLVDRFLTPEALWASLALPEHPSFFSSSPGQ